MYYIAVAPLLELLVWRYKRARFTVLQPDVYRKTPGIDDDEDDNYDDGDERDDDDECESEGCCGCV